MNQPSPYRKPGPRECGLRISTIETEVSGPAPPRWWSAKRSTSAADDQRPPEGRRTRGKLSSTGSCSSDPGSTWAWPVARSSACQPVVDTPSGLITRVAIASSKLEPQTRPAAAPVSQ